MIRNLLPYVVLTVAGVVLAMIQLGDGWIVQRSEARMPLFLGGSIIAIAGLLKSIAVATDPELRKADKKDSGD
ncbi:MAG: hypothetical protein OTJ98_05000 [Dehalococcoidia bacterium]|nr:hypothetical protein [Dehalococcoidia bacterium]